MPMLCASRWLLRIQVSASAMRDGIAPPSIHSVARRYATVAGSAVPTPDGITFIVTQDEGVGTLHDFAGKDEVSFTLLDF